MMFLVLEPEWWSYTVHAAICVEVIAQLIHTRVVIVNTSRNPTNQTLMPFLTFRCCMNVVGEQVNDWYPDV